MRFSIAELAQIRDEVSHILDELELGAYLFEVEPHEGKWEITVECGTEGEWANVRLAADKQMLLRSTDDAVAHRALLDAWSEALSACRTSKERS